MNHVGLAPSLRRVTRLPLEALHLHRTLDAIAKLGKRVGVALNPAGVRTGMALMRASVAGAV